MVNKKNKKVKAKPKTKTVAKVNENIASTEEIGVSKIKKQPFFKGFNTISITIIFVLVSVIAAFAVIMGLTIKVTINELSNKASIDSLYKIDGFKRATLDENWQSLMTEVNDNINSSQRIVYYVVSEYTGVDEKGLATYNIIDRSIELEDENALDWYEYTNPEKTNSFRIYFDKVAYNYEKEMPIGKNEKTKVPADKYMNTEQECRNAKVVTVVLGEIRDKYTKKLIKGKYLHLGIPSKNNEFNAAEHKFWEGILYLVSLMLLITLFVSFALARTITAPLAEMEKTVAKIKDGDLSGRIEMTKYQELNQLAESYNQMTNTLQRLYSTLENQVQNRTKELKSAYAELQSTQAMMVHSEKMKSLGELVAGIMHEINNPINFIYGNMTHLSNYSNDLINMIEEYNKYVDSLTPEQQSAINDMREEIDYNFLKSDLPELIKSCKEGADRAKNIIQDLKSFSRMEEVAITDVDLPTEIDTTLNILHNKIKNKAEVHKEYMENVPKIEAFGGQLNQVFMNILDNAVGAIEKQGDIWIRINKDKTGKNLVLEIEDNGVGMDQETASKVFDPFFTTKPVGQGTGLGMSITHKIIKNHQGSISVSSKVGQGTKFIITLPLNIDRENLKTAALSEGDK